MNRCIYPEHIRHATDWNDACFIMEQLVERYGNANVRCGSAYRTALHEATLTSKYWLIEAVLQFPVNVDMVDSKGETAIIMACQLGDLDNVILLAGAGANADIYDNRQDSALLWAAYNGWYNVVVFLTEELNVNVDHKFSDGRNALFWAAWRGKAAIVEYLYFITPTRNGEDNDGQDLRANLINGKLPHLLEVLERKDFAPLCLYYYRKRHPLLEIRTLGIIKIFLYDSGG